jgi:hypothetical protein
MAPRASGNSGSEHTAQGDPTDTDVVGHVPTVSAAPGKGTTKYAVFSPCVVL